MDTPTNPFGPDPRDESSFGGTASFRDDPWVPLERTDAAVVFTILGVRIRMEHFPVAATPFLDEHYPGHFALEPEPGREPAAAPESEPVSEPGRNPGSAPAPSARISSEPRSSSAPAARVDLTFRVRVDETRGTIVPPPAFPGEEVRIEIERDGEHRFRLRLLHLEATFDLSTGRGEVLFTDLRYVPFRTSLENLLRVTFAQLLLRRRAFLFHSAGIVVDGRAFLFFGPSGSGKSTVTSFSRHLPALSDDMVAIDLSPAFPEAGRVPFYGLYPPEKRAHGSYPIAAIFRLRKATPDEAERIVPLPPSIASAHLLGSLPFVNDLGVVSPETIELAGELARRVGVAELWFRKTSDFWEVVERWARTQVEPRRV